MRLLLALALALAGCATKRNTITEGQLTRMQADQYIKDAVRMSSEGIVLEPASNIDAIDRVRLTEIAQGLRTPTAVCFLERAIETMEFGEVDGEPGWVGVPEGQAKIRARVGADGNVLDVNLLESGFTDEVMEACIIAAITEQRFLPSRDNFAYHIDVFYWVSLGFFRAAQSKEFELTMRRQQATAAIAAKDCLAGRVPAGEYPVSGVNLFDRDGNTLINRIERGKLPAAVGSCVAAAFKGMRIHPEAEAFVRPAAPKTSFTVAADGSVAVTDERWLSLIEKEEEAIREARKAELLQEPVGSDVPEPDRLEVPAERPVGQPPAPRPTPAPILEVEPEEAPEEVPSGKIDLSPRRGK